MPKTSASTPNSKRDTGSWRRTAILWSAIPRVWQKSDAPWRFCHSWQIIAARQTRAMDTNTGVETLVTIAALGGLAAPIAVLLERSHRRERRGHGAGTSRASGARGPHDARTRPVARE